MTEVEQAAVESLRSSGHVVIIWTPEEIGEADASTLEDISIERGSEYLSSAK